MRIPKAIIIIIIFLSPVIIFTSVAYTASDKLTNDTIVELVKAGLSDTAIVSLIKQSPTDFDTSPSAIIKLKGANVTNTIIEAMIEKGSAPKVKNRNRTSPVVAKKLNRAEAKEILESNNLNVVLDWCIIPGKCPDRIFRLTNAYAFYLQASDIGVNVDRKALVTYLSCLENKNIVKNVSATKRSKGNFSWDSWLETTGSGEPYQLNEIGTRYLNDKLKFEFPVIIHQITGIQIMQESVAKVFFDASVQSNNEPFHQCFESIWSAQGLIFKPYAILELFDDGWRFKNWNTGASLKQKDQTSEEELKKREMPPEEPLEKESTGTTRLTRETVAEILINSTYFPRYQIINLPIGKSVNVEDLIKTAMAVDKEMGQELNVGYGCAQRLGHLSLSSKRRNIFGTEFSPLYNVSVTDEGMKYGNIINSEAFGYAQQYAYRIYRKDVYEVTGIRLIDQTTAEVEFIYRADNIGQVAICVHPNITPDKTENIGRATFVLFDDGWRVETVKVKGQYTEWVTLKPALKNFSFSWPQPFQDNAKTEATSIENQILKRRKILMTIPPYLYETKSLPDAVTTVWTDVTSPIVGQNLRESYDRFYYAALDYHGLANQSLNHARDFYNKGNEQRAKKYIDEADRYIKLMNDSNSAAIEIYNNKIDAAKELAEGIYKGSKASALYGSHTVLGPWGTKVIEGLFMGTDYAIDRHELGKDEAAKNLLSKALVKAILEGVPLHSAGDKTLSEVLTKSTTKTVGSSRLYNILDEIIQNPELKKAVMKVLSDSAAYGINKVSEDTINNILSSLKQINFSSPKKPEFITYDMRQKLEYNIKGWDVILESVEVLNGQKMIFKFAVTNNMGKDIATWIPKDSSSIYLMDSLGNRYPLSDFSGITKEPDKTTVYRGKTIRYSYIFPAPIEGARVFAFSEAGQVFRNIELKDAN